MPTASTAGEGDGPEPAAREFYLRTLSALNEAGLSYLVGGGYAFCHYTGIQRDTKDLDIFVRRDEYDDIMRILTQAGYHTELTFPHWLGKAVCEHGYVDVIFSSGNGVSTVDDAWFQHAVDAEVFGVPARLCPVEEMIWSKAFVMERERQDGADVMHLLLARGRQLDWPRLLQRFAEHWRVLFAHLCMFGFVYPSERNRIPEWVMRSLIARLELDMCAAPPTQRVCQGTLLSREQYLIDVQSRGFADARDGNSGTMSTQDIVLWTDAIATSK